MTATAARPAATHPRTSDLSVALVLGRFEGKQMIRHPVFWLGAVASIAWAITELIGTSPVLNRASMTLTWTMAPIAVSVALLSGWAVLRAKGRTDADPPMVTPAPMSQRVAGVLLGLPWAAAATFGVQLALLAWTLFRDPVTSPVWTEILMGPVYVMFAGAFSAALTRWIPHTSTPIFAVLALAVLQAVLPLDQTQWGTTVGVDWLAPLPWPQEIIPYEVGFRPAGQHILYLIGLTVVAGGIAVLDRRWSTWSVLGSGLLLAGVFGVAQMGPVDEGRHAAIITQLVGDRADLTCETDDAITYCAMPGYAAWIDDWAAAVNPMLSSVPAERFQGLEVRQYPVRFTFALNGQDYNNWWWIEPSYEDLLGRDVVPVNAFLADFTVSSLVDDVAMHLIGSKDFGESQQIVSLWLRIDDPLVRKYFDYDVSSESDSAYVTQCMVAELLSRPNAVELIRSNWQVLTAPHTSYGEAGAVLGIAVPQGYDEDGRIEGGCP